MRLAILKGSSDNQINSKAGDIEVHEFTIKMHDIALESIKETHKLASE